MHVRVRVCVCVCVCFSVLLSVGFARLDYLHKDWMKFIYYITVDFIGVGRKCHQFIGTENSAFSYTVYALTRTEGRADHCAVPRQNETANKFALTRVLKSVVPPELYSWVRTD